MSEIHVGCGNFGIYAGKVRVQRDGRKYWGDRTNVTREAIGAAAKFLLDTNLEYIFDSNGRSYALLVREIDVKSEEEQE